MKEGLVGISYETGDNISLRKMVLTKNVLFLLSYVGPVSKLILRYGT